MNPIIRSPSQLIWLLCDASAGLTIKQISTRLRLCIAVVREAVRNMAKCGTLKSELIGKRLIFYVTNDCMVARGILRGEIK